MTRIFLVRHAEASGNIEKKFHGHFDSDITNNGYIQLELLAKRFAEIKIDALYTSDLKRAKKTGLAIVGKRDIPVFENKNLRELNGGDLEDLSWHEVAQKYADILEGFKSSPHLIRMPNGESTQELQDRIKNEIFDIVEKNPQKRICITSHGMAIKTFLCYVRGLELCDMGLLNWCENTAVSVMDFSDGKIKLVAENDSSHLRSSEINISKHNWWK